MFTPSVSIKASIDAFGSIQYPFDFYNASVKMLMLFGAIEINAFLPASVQESTLTLSTKNLNWS